MKNHGIRVKAFLLRKALSLAGYLFGFGSISLLTMCAKYGVITDVSGSVKGKVSSLSSGMAIKNIEISIKEIPVAVKTDADGNYVIGQLAPQQYTIEARDVDGAENGEFQDSVKTIELLPDELESCDFALRPK
jgi:putative lipoprotein (rSAM/lipoprotein system)